MEEDKWSGQAQTENNKRENKKEKRRDKRRELGGTTTKRMEKKRDKWSGQDPDCVDLDPDCAADKASGGCENDVAHTGTNCRQTCGICQAQKKKEKRRENRHADRQGRQMNRMEEDKWSGQAQTENNKRENKK